MTIASTTSSRPRFGRIKDAVKYSGRSRGRLYLIATEHRELFRKDGSSTLVDFDVLDRILDALPVANVQIGSRGHREKQPQPQRRRRRRKAA
jgi:hypothetical protein